MAEVHPDTFDMLLIAEDLAGGAPATVQPAEAGALWPGPAAAA
jgi:hypothetical protein